MTAAAAVAQLPVEGPFGTGAAQVWVVLPEGPIRNVVVFAHGWKPRPAPPGDGWVEEFAPWLGHLAARGSAVIFPYYQRGGDATGAARVRSFREGIADAFARLPVRAPVFAAGYSYGAALAFTYAADAESWGVPQPQAVEVVFPAAPIPGVPLAPLPAPVRVDVLVGDRDTVAGAWGARQIWSSLHAHARKRYIVVRSGGAFVANHASVKLATPAAQRAFWAPLDALVATLRP